MSKFSILFVGLDGRHVSIDSAVADAQREGEICHIGSTKGDLASLEMALRKLAGLS